MNSSRIRILIGGLAILCILFSTTGRLPASPIDERYGVMAYTVGKPEVNGVPASGNVNFFPGGADQVEPGDWYKEPIVLGHFAPVWYNGNDGEEVYNNVPFTITIGSLNNFYLLSQWRPSAYSTHYDITGPASDGVVIGGVLNGTISMDGMPNLVASFLSVTGDNAAARYADIPNVTYTVDPILPSPFPISSLVLPSPIQLARYSDVNVSVQLIPDPDPVPEPSTLAFAALVIVATGGRMRFQRR